MTSKLEKKLRIFGLAELSELSPVLGTEMPTPMNGCCKERHDSAA
jgi:hypothetical protein